MELRTCNNVSSMKKVVFRHLLLKRPLSLRIFLCSLMEVRTDVLLSRRISLLSLCSSPVRPPSQLTWRKEKLVFN